MNVDEQKLKEVMASILEVEVADIRDDSSADTIATWDSLHHINLIIALEQEFDVSLPDEDVAELSSYKLLLLTLQEL